MRTRHERITAQQQAFILFGLLVLTRDDLAAELAAYRARVRDAAPQRVKIALSCARDGLPARTAMKLLNQTIEEERAV